MKNILKITIFKDDDYEIVSGNIYSTKESWGQSRNRLWWVNPPIEWINQYWIATYNMPSMSFILCSLTSPLEPIRHIFEVIDEDYDLIGHVLENLIDFQGPEQSPIDNIEQYLSKKGFSLYMS